MRKPTNPNRLALCVLLARRDHVAAHLLDRICHWAQYGKATIPGFGGTWTANDHPWWRREAALSPDQLDRSLAKLDKFSLIEREQRKFAGVNILHVRPTGFTRLFLTAAKTWDVAAEILASEGIPAPAFAEQAPTVSLSDMLAAFEGDHTAEDMARLAVYRQDMATVTLAQGEVDCSACALELILWAKEHWDKPSIEHFCAKFTDALTEATKAYSIAVPQNCGST